MEKFKEQFLEKYQTLDFHKIIDHPNILIAANFWDEDRYCAAKSCYPAFCFSFAKIPYHPKAESPVPISWDS